MKVRVPGIERFRFSTEVRVRLPETDALGIVFHGYFFTYMEVGRMDYLRNLGLAQANRPIRTFHNVVVRASSHFLSPARFDDPLVVRVRIASIGGTSFRFEFRMDHRRENRVVAVGESVHVALDERTWRPIPVPASFRKEIRDFEGKCLRETQTTPRRRGGRRGGD